MTQTGGLVVLLAWGIFAVILAALAYFLLRPAKDPLEDISTPTADQPAAPPPGSATSAAEGQPGRDR
jgi:hypothetical protein